MRRFSKVASPTWQALCRIKSGEISKGKALEIIREECERMERENYPEMEQNYAALSAQNKEVMALNRELIADCGFLRQALEEITGIAWGWEGDCGADSIARNALNKTERKS